MANTGYKISVYLDDNPNSVTYMETYTERTQDSGSCPISEADLVLISDECEIGISGYTGYRILQYYNRTTMQYLVVRELDSACTPSSGDEIWKDVNDPFCETTESGLNTGYMLQLQVNANPYSATYGFTRYNRYKTPDCVRNDCPIWEEVSRQCHVVLHNNVTTFDGTSDVVQIDTNPVSESFNQTRQINVKDTSNCENVTDTVFTWSSVGVVCGSDGVLCSNGIKYDDGRFPPFTSGKFRGIYNDGETIFEIPCDGNLTLSSGETRPSGYDFSAMTSAVIGDCVTTLGNKVLQVCPNLSSCTIGDNVTTIGNDAFDYCTSLTNIEIPNSVITIGDTAFYHCESLSSCTIGMGVTSIGNSAFDCCSGLTSIVIPNSVTTIGISAFIDCRGLTSVTIGSNVTTIGNDAFRECSSLTSIVIPSGVTSINGYVFYDCHSLTSVIIPNSVTYIGEYAFQSCYGLTSIGVKGSGASIEIPSGVTSIDEFAFSFCYGLTSVTISDSVTSIGSNAFRTCSALTTVTIGSGVTSIDSYAFFDCYNLTSVTIYATTPPALGDGVFNITNECPIYVLATSVNTYKSASGWSQYADRIRAIS